MNDIRIGDQIGAIFGAFMSIFYVSAGLYLAFFSDFYWLDKFLLKLVGITFALYGVYRAFRAYQQIRDVFFHSRKNDEE